MLTYLPQGCTPPGGNPRFEDYDSDSGRKSRYYDVDEVSGVVTARSTERGHSDVIDFKKHGGDIFEVRVKHGMLRATTRLNVTSTPPCSSMTVVPATLNIEASTYRSFDQVKFGPAGCTPPSTYTSSASQDEKVAFAAGGLHVQGVGPGSTSIRFTQGYLSTSANVVVTQRPPCTSIKLSYPSDNNRLYFGNTESATIAYGPDNCVPPKRPLVFGSRNRAVVDVISPTGDLLATGYGGTTIEVVQGLLHASAYVLVAEVGACKEVNAYILPSFVAVGQPSKAPEVYYNYPRNCIHGPSKPRFESLTPEIAVIDSVTGIVTGKKPGDANFRITDGNLSGTFRLTVYER